MAALATGLLFGVRIGGSIEQIFIAGAGALFALKGLSSDSEAVGAASIATLTLMGAGAISLTQTKIRLNRENFPNEFAELDRQNEMLRKFFEDTSKAVGKAIPQP